MNGKDTNNAVIVVFNEKPNSEDVAITDIKRIVESGGEVGGTKVDMSLELPEEAEDAFNAAFSGRVGFHSEVIAYVGSKVTNGVEQIIIAELEAMTRSGVPELTIVNINTNNSKIEIERLFELGSRDVKEEQTFSYTFNWLKK